MRESSADKWQRVTIRWTSLALGGLAATASARTDADGPVTDLIKPQTAAPEGCQISYDGKFQIQVEPMADTKVSSAGPHPRRAAGLADPSSLPPSPRRRRSETLPGQAPWSWSSRTRS